MVGQESFTVILGIGFFVRAAGFLILIWLSADSSVSSGLVSLRRLDLLISLRRLDLLISLRMDLLVSLLDLRISLMRLDLLISLERLDLRICLLGLRISLMRLLNLFCFFFKVETRIVLFKKVKHKTDCSNCHIQGKGVLLFIFFAKPFENLLQLFFSSFILRSALVTHGLPPIF